MTTEPVGELGSGEGSPEVLGGPEGETSPEPDLICHDCGKGPFKNMSGLGGHRKAKHDPNYNISEVVSAAKRHVPCDHCSRKIPEGMLAQHVAANHTPEQLERQRKAEDGKVLARISRSRGFVKWASGQPPDSTAGAMYRALGKAKGRGCYPSESGKDESGKGYGRGSILRWKALLTQQLEWQRNQEHPDAFEVADIEAALAGWDEMEKEWRVVKAGADVILGRENYYTMGEAKAPSAVHPVPVIKCVMPKCSHWAVLGGDRCESHGGSWLSPDVRQALLMSSFEGLIQASATAVETLVDVMENSRRDDARVAAAREVLDRVGIKADSDIHLHVHGESDGGESVATSLRKRLAEMNGAMKEADELKARLGIGQSEIIDAEVIDE